MSRVEIEDELGRLWSLPRGVSTETALAGGMSLADGPSFVSQFRSIVLAESYSFLHLDPSPPVIIDCGANIGLAVRWWLCKWPDARIEAFEPDPSIYEVLERNLKGVPASVRLAQVALAATDGPAQFHQLGADAGRLDASAHGSDVTVVATERLSSVLSRHERVDLLKMDIEGVEVEVLHEAEHLLGRVERVFVEYHSRVGDRQLLGSLLNLFRRAGYRYYLECPVHSARPFESVSEDFGFDLLTEIWAYRAKSE